MNDDEPLFKGLDPPWRDPNRIRRPNPYGGHKPPLPPKCPVCKVYLYRHLNTPWTCPKCKKEYTNDDLP